MLNFITRRVKMWKLVLMCSALALVTCYENAFISKGHWNIDRMELCPDPDLYEFRLDLRKNKVNRTHTVYSGFFDVKEDITDENFGIYLEAEKKVDGGYKLTHIFDEGEIYKFMNKFIPGNFKTLLTNMGADPDTEIPKGYYEIENFSFDYGELPKDGMIGTYRATAYITRATVTNEKERVVCLIIHATFQQEYDDNDDE